ncbi:hypothetical protein B0H10DRAFT_2111292, partial [Mycena sp. CBHHK59/15]
MTTNNTRRFDMFDTHSGYTPNSSEDRLPGQWKRTSRVLEPRDKAFIRFLHAHGVDNKDTINESTWNHTTVRRALEDEYSHSMDAEEVQKLVCLEFYDRLHAIRARTNDNTEEELNPDYSTMQKIYSVPPAHEKRRFPDAPSTKARPEAPSWASTSSAPKQPSQHRENVKDDPLVYKFLV